MERFESFVGSGVECLHVRWVSNKQQAEVVAGRDLFTFWWVSLCCQFRWNRNNQQSILDFNSDCGSASISSSICKLTKISAVANQKGWSKMDVTIRCPLLTSFSFGVFRHRSVELVPIRAQSWRWTCLASVRPDQTYIIIAPAVLFIPPPPCWRGTV